MNKHRDYVGGMWEEIGDLQFQFLLDNGLQEHHRVLDVACGSLRLGRHLIKYLNKGLYAGFDHNAWLIEEGIKHEVGIPAVVDKAPLFIVNDQFDFKEVPGCPTFVMIHSLFTHLTADDIIRCLAKLSNFRWSMIYATFNEGDESGNPKTSDDHDVFHYSNDRVSEFGRLAGFKSKFVGDWGHPRGQKMIGFHQ